MEKRRGTRWAKGLRVREGGLGGWQVDQPAATRHRELRKVARRDGLAIAAATDAANRSMTEGGRTAWSREDYNRAVAEYDRIRPMTEEERLVSAEMDERERRGGAKVVRVRRSRRARGSAAGGPGGSP